MVKLFAGKKLGNCLRNCLPKGLLPIDMVEFGCNRSSGFVWVKHKEQVKHKFERINKTVSYDTEVTAFFKKHRLTNVTGIKSKELLLWVTVSNIFIDDPSSGKITFQVPNGMSAMLSTQRLTWKRIRFFARRTKS